MRVLGMISGTSHDGIDVAIVDFGLSGQVLHGHIVHTGTSKYPDTLRTRLAAALPPSDTTFAEVCELDTLIGQAFAEVAAAAIAEAGEVDLVVSHGQTVYHWVEGAHAHGTLQIGQPAWIAERTKTAVLSDVRIRDITAGGHGAPLVSYLDSLLLNSIKGVAAALNLGGIANITVVHGDDLSAYDIGPANALIDAAVARGNGHPAGFDAEGAIAASGTVHEGLLAVLLAEPYYRLPAPKTTGKELFHIGYIDQAVARSGAELEFSDLVATLTELTVRTIVTDVRAAKATTLLVSGGGARNPVIMGRLSTQLPNVQVMPSDAVGAPSDDKEAIAFALLGWCTAHGLPGNHPAGTGARDTRILGTLTPGDGPLRLPEPLSAPPRYLRLETA